MSHRGRCVRPLLVVLASCLLSVSVSSQTRNPKQVAEAFFAAVAAEKWREAAGFLDLEAFDSYRKWKVAASRDETPYPTLKADDLIRLDPEMPRAVAEYQVKRAEEMRKDRGSWLSHEFARIANAGALESLGTVDAAARWIEAQDFRYKMHLADAEAKSRGCKVPSGEEASIQQWPPNKIVGEVVNDSNAYVLHIDAWRSLPDSGDHVSTAAADAAPPKIGARAWLESPPMVMQLRRVKGKWLIVGGHGLLGSGFAITLPECEKVTK